MRKTCGRASLVSVVAVVILAANAAGQNSDLRTSINQVEALWRRADRTDRDVRQVLDLLDRIGEQARGQKKEKDLKAYTGWRRANCHYWLGNAARGRELLTEALQHAQPELPFLWQMYGDLAECCLAEWRGAEAEKHIARALEALKPLGNKVKESEAVRLQLLRGRCRTVLAKQEGTREGLLAVETKTSAKAEQARKVANPDEEAEWEDLYDQCQIALAELERRNFNTLGAIKRLEAFNKRLERRQSRLCCERRFSCCLNLAFNRWTLGRFEEAKLELDEAEAILDKAAQQFPGIASDQRQHELKNARAAWHIEKATFLLHSNPADPGLLKQLDQARQLAQAALDHSRGDIFTATSYHQLAQIHELRGKVRAIRGDGRGAAGDYQQSRDYYDKALRLLGPIMAADHDYLLQVRRMRARLAAKRKEFASARKETLATLKAFTSRHGQDHVDCGLFHHLLLEIEDQDDNPRAAAEQADKQRRLSARSLANYLPRLTAPEQLLFFRMQDDPALHASLRLGIHHRTLAAPSAEWLLNGKAKLAEVRAHVNRSGRRGSDRDRDLSRQFQQSLRRQATLLYGFPRADQEVLKRTLLDEERRKRDLSEQRAVKAPTRWYALAELQEKLGADEVYIDIFRLRPKKDAPQVYCAWIVTGGKQGRVRVVPLRDTDGRGDADEIDKLARDFLRHQEAFAAPGGAARTLGYRLAEEKLKKSLRRLSALVLDPLLPYTTGKKRWVVSPDGDLWSVPWAALLWPNSDKYAIEEVSFRYVVSGRDLIGTEAPRVQPGPPWIFANPELDRPPEKGTWRGRARRGEGRLGKLPAAAQEGRDVAGLLRKSLAVAPRLIGEGATKESLLGLTEPPRILYLATHGLSPIPTRLRAADPLLCCGVAFAGYNLLPGEPADGTDSLPGLLTGAEVLALDLHGTELVVLSACQTGTGGRDYGQSPADLRHAFHLAGARAVVSALWTVSDRHTSSLMVSFIKSLDQKGKITRAEALRKAQLQMIEMLRESDDNHAHPFFWAAFTLSGS